MIKDTLRYFDYRYFLRFAGLFFLFYLTYTFIHAASVPSGTYYPFVEKYLNFPVLIRYAVLYTGEFLLSLIGYQTTVVNDRLISQDGFSVLEMAWACYGLGVKSFWVAFIFAHQLPVKTKIYWSVGGVLAILALNCVRVVVMMLSMLEKWTIAEYLGTNAHDLFNYVCYAALLGLILLFYAKVKTYNTPKPKSTVPSIKSEELNYTHH